MPYQYSILCTSPFVRMNENTEIGEASNIAGTPPSPTEVSFFERGCSAENYSNS